MRRDQRRRSDATGLPCRPWQFRYTPQQCPPLLSPTHAHLSPDTQLATCVVPPPLLGTHSCAQQHSQPLLQAARPANYQSTRQSFFSCTSNFHLLTEFQLQAQQSAAKTFNGIFRRDREFKSLVIRSPCWGCSLSMAWKERVDRTGGKKNGCDLSIVCANHFRFWKVLFLRTTCLDLSQTSYLLHQFSWHDRSKQGLKMT